MFNINSPVMEQEDWWDVTWYSSWVWVVADSVSLKIIDIMLWREKFADLLNLLAMKRVEWMEFEGSNWTWRFDRIEKNNLWEWPSYYLYLRLQNNKKEWKVWFTFTDSWVLFYRWDESLWEVSFEEIREVKWWERFIKLFNWLNPWFPSWWVPEPVNYLEKMNVNISSANSDD